MVAMFVSLLLAAVLHDLGHVVCARAVGVKVKKWRAFYIVRESGTDLQNLLVTAAGPLTNLLLAGAVFACPWFGMKAIQFGMANFAIGVLNLVPLRFSDGHRLLMLMRRSRVLDTPTP